MDSRRAIAAAMGQMKAPDLGEQGAIGCLAWAFGPTAPGIIPRRRDAHHVAQDANRERLALILDDAGSIEAIWKTWRACAVARQLRTA